MEISCPIWIQSQGGALYLLIHCQPGAKMTRVLGEHGGRLKMALSAPAVDNKANEALVAWLAERLGIPRRQVEIVSGQTGRQKRVRVQGLDVQSLLRVLNQ